MRALEKGFIGFPAHLDDIPHTSHRSDVEHREMGSLYRSLPRPILSGEEYAQVLQAARETLTGGG